MNEGVREKENSDRLEWIQTHVQCDGLAEVRAAGLSWVPPGKLWVGIQVMPSPSVDCLRLSSAHTDSASCPLLGLSLSFLIERFMFCVL